MPSGSQPGRRSRSNYKPAQPARPARPAPGRPRIDGSSQFQSSASAILPIPTQEVRDLNQNSHSRPQITLPLPEPLKEIARQRVQLCEYNYALLLEELGYFGIIDTAHHENQIARQHHSFRNDASLSQLHVWKHLGVQILADIPLSLLQSLLDSSLSRRVCQVTPENSEVAHFFDESNLEEFFRETGGRSVEISHWVTRCRTGDHVPVIYARIFHDKSGSSPSPHQLRNVINCLHKYISGDARDDELCKRIDNQFRPNTSSIADIRAGRHNFLGKSERAQTVLTFITALSRALDEDIPSGNEAQHDPWNRTLKYFGYSKNFVERNLQHETNSSSWLMKLFEHVCRVLFRDQDDIPLFKFEAYTVAYPVTFEECQLAEELLCRVGSGYYYTGLGFNIQNAGVGVYSSKLATMISGESKILLDSLANARHRNPLWDDQLCADFNTFNARYVVRCDEETNVGAYERLEEEADALQAQIDQVRANPLPITKLRDSTRIMLEECDELQRQAASHDPSSVEDFRRLRQTLLEPAQSDARRVWGEDLGI